MASRGEGGPPGGLAGQRQAGPRLWRDEGLKVPYKRRKKRLTGHRRPRRGDVPDPPERPVGDGLPVRRHHRRPHHQAAQRHRRVHPRVPRHRRRSLHRRRRRRRHSSTASPPSGARRRSSGSTTVPSSSLTPWPTGAGSTASPPCSSIPARHGRTPGSSRSTAGYRDELLNSWQFDSLLEARVIIEDWRIDYNEQPAPHRPRRPHPHRVRPGLDHQHQPEAA